MLSFDLLKDGCWFCIDWLLSSESELSDLKGGCGDVGVSPGAVSDGEM